MRRLYYLLPIIAFGVLTYFLFGSLHAPPPITRGREGLPSSMISFPPPKRKSMAVSTSSR